MGSLWMTKLDMDGDSVSPFNSINIDQIKAILHRDVDKELDHAIKIAKEVNSRIYQVHRNLLIQQNYRPSCKVIRVQEKEENEDGHLKNENSDKRNSDRSSDSNEFDSVLKSSLKSFDRTLSPNKKCLSNSKTSFCHDKSTYNLLNSQSIDEITSCDETSREDQKYVKCDKINPQLNSNFSSHIKEENSQNGFQKDSSNYLTNSQNLEEEVLKSEKSDPSSRKPIHELRSDIKNCLHSIFLDHDYLKANVWANLINISERPLKHKLTNGSVSSDEVSDDFHATDHSPSAKKVRTELVAEEKSCLEPLKPKNSDPSFPNLISNRIDEDDFKYDEYDEFLNASSYFDKDLVVFDKNPFSYNNFDLPSFCDIFSSNFINSDDRFNEASFNEETPLHEINCGRTIHSPSTGTPVNDGISSTVNGASSIKLRFTIGTVSKSLLASEKSCHETHIWKIYVRNTFNEDVPLNKYIAKIRFLIHDSYAPNNLIERKEPPFEITRRGWGEFPIRVQIFFRFNKKPICLVHQLTLVKNVINILTLGIQKHYELMIPSFSKKSQSSNENVDFSSDIPNGYWKNSGRDSIVKDTFDFKIKEIDTVAKINELICQDTVPSDNNIQKSETSCSASANSWSTFSSTELKNQLCKETNFFTNFSDLNHIKVLVGSIKNYYERIIFLLEILPIITPHAASKWYKRTYPYSCHSRKVFNSWPIGKQRASEFCRARMVKFLASSESNRSWSTNEIVVFARRHENQSHIDPITKASLVSLAKTLALQQLEELEKQLAQSKWDENVEIT